MVTYYHDIARAETFRDLAATTEEGAYWRGYARGLRRKRWGVQFGTQEEHALLLGLCNDPVDALRRSLGRGYRDALLGLDGRPHNGDGGVE